MFLPEIKPGGQMHMSDQGASVYIILCGPEICLRSYVPDLADSCYCLCL